LSEAAAHRPHGREYIRRVGSVQIFLDSVFRRATIEPIQGRPVAVPWIDPNCSPEEKKNVGCHVLVLRSRPADGPAATLRVAALWSLLRKKAAQRNLRRQLYGIEPRLLDDMGFDPADVYDAFHGGIGEVHGDRFRGLFPSRCAR
jgi:uncharacterized protein YjiS (DUF1127 family)